MDFGYSFTQQRFFYKFRELADSQVLSSCLTGPTTPCFISSRRASPRGARAHHAAADEGPLPGAAPPHRTGRTAAGRQLGGQQQPALSNGLPRDWVHELMELKVHCRCARVCGRVYLTHILQARPRETPLERFEAEKAMYELTEDFAEAAEDGGAACCRVPSPRYALARSPVAVTVPQLLSCGCSVCI